MPVAIRTQPIDGDPWLKATTTNSTTVFNEGWLDQDRELGEKGIMQSSLGEGMSESNPGITPSINGLVDATIEAWNNHQHLVLRPDEMWLSILSQLGFFINAHAEELREFRLRNLRKKMADEISKNVKDPDLVPWIIPHFTTTTDTDRVVGSVLLMGAMQQYFTYTFDCSMWGIPSITLLGDRADWVDLQERINKIPRLGGEAVEFRRLPAPIARHMILSFDEPTSEAVLQFWCIIALREPPRYYGSGRTTPECITGWITTFCFWKPDGEKNEFGGERPDCEIDEVRYLALDSENKVSGWASTPVTVNWVDSGVLVESRKCRMVAGSIGMRPGRHVEMGVRLEGLPLPPLEQVTVDDSSDDGSFDEPKFGMQKPGESVKPRQMPGRLWVRNRDTLEQGAPSLEKGLDVVRSYVGWWIFHESEKNEGADDADSDGVIR